MTAAESDRTPVAAPPVSEDEPRPPTPRGPGKLAQALQSVPVATPAQRDAIAETTALLQALDRAEAGPDDKMGMRQWIARDLRRTLKSQQVSGLIAEIGGSRNGLKRALPEWDFRYLSLYPGNDPDLIVADITACPQVPSDSFDAVVSVNCYEHVERPWRAAEEITRILKPGGVTYHVAPFSYFYHRAPIDYWRYTPDAFGAMFRDLEPLKAEFYGANRRRNNLGSETNAVDRDGGEPFAPDGFGGWRENWYIVYAGRKTPEWRLKRIERERNQLIVDIWKTLERRGSPAESLATATSDVLSRLWIAENGEVLPAFDGRGLGVSREEAKRIWESRGRLRIKPSFRGFSRLAISTVAPPTRTTRGSPLRRDG